MNDKNSKAAQILDLIGRIFAEDKGLKDIPIVEIGDKRQNMLKFLLDEYWEFLGTIQAANGSNLDKAVNYSLNHKEHLNNFVLDNCLELTNNRAKEQSSRLLSAEKLAVF